MTVHIKAISLDGIQCADLVNRSPVKDVPGAASTLEHCVRISNEVFAGIIDGETVCIWGLVAPTLLSDQAYMWLLVTEGVKDNQFVFVRQSQLVIKQLLQRYPILTGNCLVGETRSIRWLKWLGADFEYVGNKVLSFTIRRKHG